MEIKNINNQKKFIALEEAILFHKEIQKVKFPAYLKNQILRSSLSIALNLSEGAARRTNKDKRRLYNIAFASLRETQVALRCSAKSQPSLEAQADRLGALLYRLVHSIAV